MSIERYIVFLCFTFSILCCFVVVVVVVSWFHFSQGRAVRRLEGTVEERGNCTRLFVAGRNCAYKTLKAESQLCKKPRPLLPNTKGKKSLKNNENNETPAAALLFSAFIAAVLQSTILFYFLSGCINSFYPSIDFGPFTKYYRHSFIDTSFLTFRGNKI